MEASGNIESKHEFFLSFPTGFKSTAPLIFLWPLDQNPFLFNLCTGYFGQQIYVILNGAIS